MILSLLNPRHPWMRFPATRRATPGCDSHSVFTLVSPEPSELRFASYRTHGDSTKPEESAPLTAYPVILSRAAELVRCSRARVGTSSSAGFAPNGHAYSGLIPYSSIWNRKRLEHSYSSLSQEMIAVGRKPPSKGMSFVYLYERLIRYPLAKLFSSFTTKRAPGLADRFQLNIQTL